RTKYVWPGEGRRDFAISPDGTKAVELVGGQILLRDLAAFTEPQRVGSGGHRAAFSPDGKRFAVAHRMGRLDRDDPKPEWKVTVYNVEGKVLLTWPAPAYSHLAFSPDGTTLIAGDDGLFGVTRWNAQTGERLSSMTVPRRPGRDTESYRI